MIIDVIRRLNWVDVFIIILFARICYISVKGGFFVELFKLPGTIFAIYLALHYYTKIADFLLKRPPGEIVPLDFLDFLSFVLLAALGYVIFALARITFLLLVKIETISVLNRWGGLIIGIARSILFISLVVYGLTISSITYFRVSVNSACMGRAALKIAPGVYSSLWYSIFSKFMPQEKLNQNVLDVEKNILDNETSPSL